MVSDDDDDDETFFFCSTSTVSSLWVLLIVFAFVAPLLSRLLSRVIKCDFLVPFPPLPIAKTTI